MQNETRLSLEDFKLNKIESENEIEKMLGEAAATCHVTSHDSAPLGGGWTIEVGDLD